MPSVALAPYSSIAAFFGSEVRRHRDRRGWKQEDLARRIRWSASLVAMEERGERLPLEGFGARCDEAYGLPEVLAGLERLVHNAPNWFTQFVKFEAQATRISIWDMRLVPGILQTADYARAIITATTPFMKADDIEKAVGERMARPALLERPDPPVINVLLHECVVRQPLADLRGQSGADQLPDRDRQAARRQSTDLAVLGWMHGRSGERILDLRVR